MSLRKPVESLTQRGEQDGHGRALLQVLPPQGREKALGEPIGLWRHPAAGNSRRGGSGGGWGLEEHLCSGDREAPGAGCEGLAEAVADGPDLLRLLGGEDQKRADTARDGGLGGCET